MIGKFCCVVWDITMQLPSRHKNVSCTKGKWLVGMTTAPSQSLKSDGSNYQCLVKCALTLTQAWARTHKESQIWQLTLPTDARRKGEQMTCLLKNKAVLKITQEYSERSHQTIVPSVLPCQKWPREEPYLAMTSFLKFSIAAVLHLSSYWKTLMSVTKKKGLNLKLVLASFKSSAVIAEVPRRPLALLVLLCLHYAKT